MLKLDGVHKKFKSALVAEQISVDLGPCTYGLLGRNGSGKTTLLRCITRVEKVNGGRIVYTDGDGREVKDYLDHIGYLPQNFDVFPELTAYEVLQFFANLKGYKITEEEIDHLLEILNLSPQRDMTVKTLSGGMKRRLGIAQALIGDPDVLLLDLGLPDMDGSEIIRSVRTWSRMPIIIISARSAEIDKAAALDMGADDYLTKPFGTVELLARIRTALRHTRTDGTSDGLAMTGEYHVGDLCIDYNKHRVFLAGEDTHLTPNEYKIVALLGRHAGQVLTYKSMMKELWGPGVGGDNKLLRVHMANIRRKIEPNPVEPQYIFTEVGVGYRMADSH